MCKFKTLFFLGILLLGSNIMAQGLSNEAKIIDFLGQEKFDQIQQSNPSYLNYLDVRCSEGFEIMDYVDEKMNNMPMLKKIRVKDYSSQQGGVINVISPEELVQAYESGNFNFLLYQLSYHQSQMTYHVLGKTGKVLMIYPITYINKLVNSNK